MSGAYTLLLYGCHYPDDIKNVAILVDEKSADAAVRAIHAGFELHSLGVRKENS